MPQKTIRSNWLCLLLVAILLVMMVAPAALARPVEKQAVLIGFHSAPGKAEIGLITAFGGQVSRVFSIVPVVAAELPANAVQALSRHPLISYIEPDYEVFAVSQTIPWGIPHVRAPEAWTAGTEGAGIKVAVLDTGIGPHTDLQVLGGWNTLDNNGNYNDGHGHGTHVAGSVAALDNNLGVVGVAPQAHLYAVKVLSDSGSGTTSSVVAGIEWAQNNGMKIVNMSLGASSGTTTLENACNNAYNAGLLLVAAAGNSGNLRGTGNNINYPARYNSVIAVAAIDKDNKRASFSSTGDQLELSAPGVSVYSTVPGGYVTYSGTSMASPHVAGVAALVWANNPELSNTELRNLLNETASDLGVTGRDQHFGFGLVNALAAVTGAPPPNQVQTGTITGTVKEAGTGLAIDGANITAVKDGTTFTAVTENNGGYTLSLPVGTYSVTASKTGYESKTESVIVSNESSVPVDFVLTKTSTATTVGVVSVNYSTNGGKNNNQHLSVTLTVADNFGNKVSGASVSIQLTRDGKLVASGTGTSGSNGTVTFTLNNAPKGTYTTTVTNVFASGLTWDGVTPANSFTKN